VVGLSDHLIAGIHFKTVLDDGQDKRHSRMFRGLIVEKFNEKVSDEQVKYQKKKNTRF